MNITDKIYVHDKYIKEFEQDWFKISKKEHISWLEECKQFFIVDKKRLDDEREDKNLMLSFVYKKTPLEKLVNALDCNVQKAYDSLNKILDIIKEYTSITKEKIMKDDYYLTLSHLSLILDLDETFISRAILQDNFDFFNMNYLARLGIKKECEFRDESFISEDFYISKNSINKKVFISRASIFNFLKKYLKYTEDRVRIEVNFSMEQRYMLKKLYPEYNDIKKAINMVTNNLESKFENQLNIYKNLAADEQPDKEKYSAMLTKDKKRVKREFLQTHDLCDDDINDIIDRNVNMVSLKSMKNYIKKQKNLIDDSFRLTHNKQDNVMQNHFNISVNDTQIYYLLEKCLTYKRLVFENLYKQDERDSLIIEAELQLKVNTLLGEKILKASENKTNFNLNVDVLNKLKKEALSEAKENYKKQRKITYVRYITDIDILSREFLNKLSEEERLKSKDIMYAEIALSLNSVTYKNLITLCKSETEIENRIREYYYEEVSKLRNEIINNKKNR